MPPWLMQMVFHYYLVAWNEGLPKAAPLLWRCDLIFAAVKANRWPPSDPPGRRGVWTETGCGQPTDLWVISLAALGRQPARASDGAQMTEAIGL